MDRVALAVDTCAKPHTWGARVAHWHPTGGRSGSNGKQAASCRGSCASRCFVGGSGEDEAGADECRGGGEGALARSYRRRGDARRGEQRRADEWSVELLRGSRRPYVCYIYSHTSAHECELARRSKQQRMCSSALRTHGICTTRRSLVANVKAKEDEYEEVNASRSGDAKFNTAADVQCTTYSTNMLVCVFTTVRVEKRRLE